MHIKTEDYDDTEADHAYDLLSLAYFGVKRDLKKLQCATKSVIAGTVGF